MKSRLKVSVCIAAFNGERYIALQLRSILAQLSLHDEVIVVDDCSTDSTCDEVRGIKDSRIHLFHNSRNQGVLGTFEAALSRSSGDIVFLSDQDDLWLDNKVSTILDAFAADNELNLLATDAIFIDDRGRKIGDSYYAQRGDFSSGLLRNLLFCKFLGCTMAFHSSLLKDALPFPKSKYIHHDIWIGLINTLAHRKVIYLDKPLVAYRRHDTNVTGRVTFSMYKRFRMRWDLICALLRFKIASMAK